MGGALSSLSTPGKTPGNSLMSVTTAFVICIRCGTTEVWVSPGKRIYHPLPRTPKLASDTVTDYVALGKTKLSRDAASTLRHAARTWVGASVEVVIHRCCALSLIDMFHRVRKSRSQSCLPNECASETASLLFSRFRHNQRLRVSLHFKFCFVRSGPVTE